MKKELFVFLLLCFCFLIPAHSQILRKPIPDKLVVLTFDDAAVTHATYVAPLLKKYGFGASFYVCEFPPDFADKTKYMSWDQMQQLHKKGFEVASHTKNHQHVNKITKAQFTEELNYIEEKCNELRMKKPVTFAYPGYSTHPMALEVLKEKGYIFARVGGSRPYNPETDHPYLLPSYSTTGTDAAPTLKALQEAKDGKIVILTIHGVPDYAHDWVTTPPALFEEYLKYLKENNYKVIALRDLKKYINTKRALEIIEPNFSNLVTKP